MRLLLLDADVVIELHRLGVWEQLIEKHEITLASTVLHDEARFYYAPDTERKVYLNLEDSLREGKILEASATAIELAAVLSALTKGPEVDAGELESLAVINRGGEPYRFCSANEHAIAALVLLGYGSRGISPEKLLDNCGLHRRVADQFSEARFKTYVRKANIRLIQQT